MYWWFLCVFGSYIRNLGCSHGEKILQLSEDNTCGCSGWSKVLHVHTLQTVGLWRLDYDSFQQNFHTVHAILINLEIVLEQIWFRLSNFSHYTQDTGLLVLLIIFCAWEWHVLCHSWMSFFFSSILMLAKLGIGLLEKPQDSWLVLQKNVTDKNKSYFCLNLHCTHLE